MNTSTFQALNALHAQIGDPLTDVELLGQLRVWAAAVAKVREMPVDLGPLDANRYWHYFECTD